MILKIVGCIMQETIISWMEKVSITQCWCMKTEKVLKGINIWPNFILEIAQVKSVAYTLLTLEHRPRIFFFKKNNIWKCFFVFSLIT
jgi:hypothetical protein